MVTSIYVISDPPNANLCRYKVGAWFNDKEKLINRYITSHPELQICYYVDTPKAYDVESIFKKLNRDKRIRNIRGRRSEWFVMPIKEIIQQLNHLIATDLEVYPEYKCIKISQSTVQRTQSTKIIIENPVMYLDNFNHSSFDETRLINPIEAQILKQRFKNEGLSNDEAGLLDKWFFIKLVKAEHVSAELFNEWLINRRIFFHIWFEKHSNLSVKLINKFKKYYKCLNNLSIDQVNIVNCFNQVIGIQCSCQPFHFYENDYHVLWSHFYTLICALNEHFDFTSISNNSYEVVTKYIIKLFDYWNGIYIQRIRHRPRVNGKQVDNYNVNSGGNLGFYIKIEGNDGETI